MFYAQAGRRNCNAAVTPDTKGVPDEEDHSGDDQSENVPGVKAGKSGGAGITATDSHAIEKTANPGDGFDLVSTGH